MGFDPVSNLIRCSISVISPSLPVVHTSSCFVSTVSIFVRITFLSTCPRSIRADFVGDREYRERIPFCVGDLHALR